MPQKMAWELFCSKLREINGNHSAKIKKETLGLVSGCEKVHSYGYGLPIVTAEIDHELLVSIIKKNLNMSPMMADALFRAPAPSSDLLVSSSSDDVETHVNMGTASLPVSDVMVQQIVQEPAKDPVLLKVVHHIHNG